MDIDNSQTEAGPSSLSAVTGSALDPVLASCCTVHEPLLCRGLADGGGDCAGDAAGLLRLAVRPGMIVELFEYMCCCLFRNRYSYSEGR